MWIVFFAYFCLASAITANKIALTVISPAFFVALRMLTAGLILSAYNRYRSESVRFESLKTDASIFLAISLLTTFIPALLKAYALKHLFSAKQALIGGFDPFVTALYAYLLLGQKLTKTQLCGILVGFIGIMVTLVSTSAPEQSLHAWLFFSWPELAMLAAVFIVRYGWLTIRKLLLTKDYSPSQVNAITMVISGCIASVYALCTEQIMLASLFSFKISTALLYTIIVGNVFGYTLFSHSFKKYNVTLVALAGFSIPLMVSLFGYFLLNEPITANWLIAVALLFAGLVIFNIKEIKKLVLHKENGA